MRRAAVNIGITNAPKLRQEDLLALIKGEILALRIRPFATQEECTYWQQCIEQSGLLARYSNAPDVGVNRIGMTLFETENKPEKLALYLEKAQVTMHKMDKIFGGDNPLSIIFDALTEEWAKGYEYQQLDGRQMNPGIIRSFEACGKKGGLPAHTDSLLKDLPNTKTFQAMQCQLAANLYINTAGSGGELELWDFAPNEQQLAALYSGSYDFIDRDKLPVSPSRMLPKVGELIIFRSDCVHAVTPSHGGVRSAASCFLGYYGMNQALTVWA